GSITADKVVPLSLSASGSYNYRISATEFVDFEEDQQVYLKDHLTGVYFGLRSGQAYEFSSEAGNFATRFEIVFQSEETLSTEVTSYEYHLIYYNNQSDKLIGKGFEKQIDQLRLFNILGQTILSMDDINLQELDSGIQLSNVTTGTYVVYLKTDNQVTTKKIIID
ncbi:MAG: T9SS type A sorting domain-containing protein, partial [Psychroserpens sp.]|nr:T9SS type A sorting domain-containing protein [Psychroserpens sp.]